MLWTYRQAWFCLVGSTLATLTLSLSGYWIWQNVRKARLEDKRNTISFMIQTGPEREALTTTYLAEVLGLSFDQPISLYAFDLKQAKQKLCSCPMIVSAQCKRVPPNALYVDYTTRKPIAALADYQNIGLDYEGYLFPLSPFFSPKNLSEIYLGLPPFGEEKEDSQGRKGGKWLTPLQNQHLRLGLKILQALDEAPWREGMALKRIDVSNAFAPSYGQREIVLFTEESLLLGTREIVFPKILRLSTKDYQQQLSNFLSLRRTMLEDYRRQLKEEQFASLSPEEKVQFAPRIIDLRIPKLAFVQNTSS